MKKNWIKYGLVALLCLPLFFINIKTSHDWGDDFAEYIHQAKNITQGIPQSQTGYIYNPDNPALGPPSSPIGFPLLLVPVYALFGNNIAMFDLYTSLFLFIYALVIFHFLYKHFSALFSGLLVLIFVYNPWTLSFKMEIMSDIPFSLLLLICLLIYDTEKPLNYLKSFLLALLIGFLISIRNIGLAFIIAIGFDCLIQLYKNSSAIKQKQYNYKKLFSLLIIAIGGFLSYFVLTKFIYNTGGDGVFSYKYFFDTEHLKYYIQTDLDYYMAVLRAFFDPWNQHWQFVAEFSGDMIFAFIVLGMLKKMTEEFDFIDGFALIYLVIIMIYPFSAHAGFRFLLPLTPFLLYYAVRGLQSININLHIHKNILAITMTLFVFFAYKKGLYVISKMESTTLQGPQQKESLEAFNYIINNTPQNARFDFIKPRALALYTNRSAMSNQKEQFTSIIDQNLMKNNISYILVNNEISDDSLKLYVRTYQKNWTPMWSNRIYQLYKRK